MGHDQFCKVSARKAIIHASLVYSALKLQHWAGVGLTGFRDVLPMKTHSIVVVKIAQVLIWSQLLAQTLVFIKLAHFDALA